MSTMRQDFINTCCRCHEPVSMARTMSEVEYITVCDECADEETEQDDTEVDDVEA